MALTFEYEKALGAGATPFIEHELDNGLWQYKRIGTKLENFVTYPPNGRYDALTFAKKPSMITAKQISNFGLKHLPGFGAFGYFTPLYQDNSFVLCPIHNRRTTGQAPVVTITALAEGFRFDISSTAEYECYRIELIKDYFTEEYITYAVEGTVQYVVVPEMAGTLQVRVTGYIDEISIASIPWEGTLTSVGKAPFVPTGIETAAGSAIQLNPGNIISLVMDGQTTQTVTAQSANILPNKRIGGETQTTLGITFTTNSDKTITATGTATGYADFYLAGASTDTGAFRYPLKAGGYYFRSTAGTPQSGVGLIIRTNLGNHFVTATAPYSIASDCYIYGVAVRVEQGTAVSNYVFSPAVALTNIAYTPFVPASPSTLFPSIPASKTPSYILVNDDQYTVTSPTLRSLPNGIKDTFDVIKGTGTARIKSVIIDNNSTIVEGTLQTSGYTRYAVLISDIKVSSGANMYCSHFPTTATDSNGALGCGGWFAFSFAYFRVPDVVIGITSSDNTPELRIAKFKAWLALNPVTLVYEKATHTAITQTPIPIPLRLPSTTLSNPEQIIMHVQYPVL